MGPVEYVILEFPDHQFHAEIAPALGRLVERRTVRLLDMVFLRKEPDGSVGTFEFDELDELAPFAALDGEAGGLINEEDMAYAVANLGPDEAAVVIVWEDTWATEFADAVRAAGGTLLEGARIPAALVDSALAGLGRAD